MGVKVSRCYGTGLNIDGSNIDGSAPGSLAGLRDQRQRS